MLSIVKKSQICLLITTMLSAQFLFAPSPKAYAASTETNVALGNATVTTNGTVTNGAPLSLIVDGDRTTSNYVLINASTGPKWVQLDLGESFNITKVNVLNDYNPTAPRTGRDIIVQVSNDPSFASGVTTIFNNDSDNTAGQGAGTDAAYLEPTDGSGKTITISTAVNARYVRSWANGHIRSADGSIQTVNTPVELEVYTATPATNSALPISVNLTAGSPTVNSTVLSWNSPGPAAIAGYDIRYSTSPITSANWDNGLVVKRLVGEPAPAAASSAQTMTVNNLPSGTTIYFAMKTVGSDGRVSDLSTVASVSTKPVVNVALGKSVTTNAASVTNQPISALTDGVVTRDKYALYSVSDGPKWAQIDLGKAYDVSRINLRNDWGSDSTTYRTGKDIIVQLSNDPSFVSGVTTVFNNDGDNSSGLGAGTDAEYLEPGDGSGKDILLANTVNARYVRYWANGHVRVNGQVNLVDTPVEVEVYADPQDPTPPAAVTDLSSTRTTWKAVDLSWTAPGNDGNTGTALSYDVRYSTSPITEANWASALSATGEPAPQVAGTTQTFTVGGLTPSTTYYFAMKTNDVVNQSTLSNVLSATTLASDTIAPAAITDLQVSNAMIKSAKLTWTAPGNDGNLGNAASYDVRYSTSPITDANWATATQALDELPQQPVGSAMQFKVKELTAGTTYYFAIRTMDDVGNISDLSNVVSATIATPTADAVTVSSLSDLQQAIDNAPAGGRVITLAAGTYNQSTTIAITGKNNITIQGATANYTDTVVKGLGINNASLDINFKVNNSDYVTFKNLTIQDSNFHAIQINEGSNYFHADHLKTWDNGEGGFKTTFSLTSGTGYADYGLIENSMIGYTVSGVQSVVEGIDLIAGRGWVVRGNTIQNAKTSNGGGGYGVFAKANSIDTIIENNVLKNNFVAMSFGGGGSGVQFFRNQDTTYEHRGGIMRNNVIYGTSDAGIYMNLATGFKVYNNTILNIGAGVGAVESRYAQSSGEVRNNLMSGTVKLRDGGTATQSNNLTNASSSWLVDPANGDFHLHPFFGSAARDVGITLADVPTDMDGQARPYGSAPDIGADEFYPNETIPPAAISDLSASNITARSFKLTWSAVGDDGMTGTAYAYDVRYANAPITEANWDNAQKVENAPLPQAPGTSQSMTVYGPTAGATVYAAVKTIDDQGNVSALSNLPSITMLASSDSEFTPTDDAYVANSGDRSGTSGSLISLNNGNSTYWSYVKANFTSFAGSSAEQAILRFYVPTKTNKPWPVTIYGLNSDTWTESTVTASNKPDETGMVTLGTIQVDQPGWYDFDVTDFVNSQMSDKIVTFKIHDPLAQGGSLYINSSENAYNQLYLVVNATDIVAPAAITDLAAGQKTLSSVVLNWTAPGDDGNVRTASVYDVRYSSSPITEANWSAATPVVGEPSPKVAGTKQQFTVLGLTKGATYYFAMKTRDNANNESALSNVLQVVMESTVNVALGKSVTTNGTITNGVPLSYITDGVTARDQYVLINVADGAKWVQVDLTQAYPISRINIRNDWGADPTTYRTGKDIIVQVSNDPTFATGVTTLFNNDADNSAGQGVGTDAEYQEPSDGSGKNIVPTTPISARYVRTWANGHVRVNGQVNLVNTPVEVEVYADPGDSTPPAAVSNLSSSNTTWKTTTLSWTAPGDDGNTGTAQSYDIRYYTAPITENNWNDAVQLPNEPAPQPAGTVQTLNVAGLPPGTTLYFALRSFDEAVNASALSNVLMVTTPASDPTPPSAISDLQAVAPNIHSVQLTWTAPGNDGTLGKAAGYDLRYSTSPITEANWASATQSVDELAQRDSGLAMKFQVNQLDTGVTYYFAVKTYDDAGNYSALSNVVSAATFTPTPDAVTVSSLSDLQQAIDNAPAGGRIITLAAGTYSQTTTIQITGKDNITIQGATSNYNDTVVVGPGINSTVLDINFKVNGSDYVTFKNLTIRDSYFHSIQVNEGSDYFHADHLKTWDNGEGGFKSTSSGNLELPYNDYGTIENSLIGYTTTGQRGSVEGVDLIAAKGWIIRGNTFQNVMRSDYSAGYGFFAKGNSMDTVVENNVFKNNAIAMSFGGGGTAPQYFRNGDTTLEHRGGIMRNNVVYGTLDTAVYLNLASNFKVYNNTMLGIAPNVAVGGIESRFVGSSGEIRNNLMDKAVKLRDGGTAVQSNNISNASTNWLVNGPAGDYHLNPSTAQAAIDTGYALPVDVPTDMDGQQRPVGAGYDIGADEKSAAPAAPTSVTASVSGGSVQVSWNASSGATGYDVKRATVSGGPYTTIASNVSASPYTDSTASAGTTYYYVVAAVNVDGSSPNSSEASVTVALLAPTSVTASVYGGTVTVSWNASSGATGYDVKRATVSGGPYTTIAPNISASPYTDSTVTAGTTYYYVVAALNASNSSPNSAEAGVTVTALAPTGVTASGGNASVSLSWTASTGAASYNVKRSTANGGPYTTVASGVTAASYTDSTVSNGFTYYYVVSAVNSGGESANSAQVSATPTSGAALSRTGWTATASATTYAPANALDGNLTTRWSSSSAQAAGKYYQVNMGSAKTFNKIVMDANGSNDYPRGYEVYVSSDGTNWGTAVASGTGTSSVVTVTFPIQTAQYIKVVLTAAASPWWSIHEFNVYEP